MGRQLIKCECDVDFYVEWSSIVDAPTFYGTREQMTAYLMHEYATGTRRWDFELSEVNLRFERADEFGTSMFRPLGCGWEDEGEMYMPGHGTIPRAKIRELVERLDRDEDVSDLLIPFEEL